MEILFVKIFDFQKSKFFKPLTKYATENVTLELNTRVENTHPKVRKDYENMTSFEMAGCVDKDAVVVMEGK